MFQAVVERWGASHLPWRFLDVLISTECLGTESVIVWGTLFIIYSLLINL